jgi:Flp pilus assembly protein TadD
MLAMEAGTLPATAEPAAYFSALAALEETHPEASIDTAYRSGLQAWPEDRNLLTGYGNLLYQLERPAEAADQFRQVITLYPAYAPAWNNLAQILFEQGNTQQARIHAREAVALGGAFIDTYRATLLKIDASTR